MKHCSWMRRLLLAVAVFTLAGCATNMINWAERVGNYTHDQAILELGPPEKESKLTDGTVVADWLTRRSRSVFYSGIGGYYGSGGPNYYGAFSPAYVSTTPDYFLRLTFNPDGRLAAWKKFAR
jgi:hypothetical protein